MAHLSYHHSLIAHHHCAVILLLINFSTQFSSGVILAFDSRVIIPFVVVQQKAFQDLIELKGQDITLDLPPISSSGNVHLFIFLFLMLTRGPDAKILRTTTAIYLASIVVISILYLLSSNYIKRG